PSVQVCAVTRCLPMANTLRPGHRSTPQQPWPGLRLAGLSVILGISNLQPLGAQSPRLEVIQAMLQRPNDPWPRGQGHVVLAVPGCAEASKGYHEPGGSFSPGFSTFGVAI